MDLEVLKQARHIVTGTKQTIKAVAANQALHVFIARDAAEHITKPLLAVCRANNIPVTQVDSMEELGQACQIKVKAATAAVLQKN